MKSEKTLTLNEGGFIGESSLMRTEYQWAIVHKLLRTKKRIFIFIDKRVAFIISRRSFESTTAWDEFYNFCQSKIKKS